MEKLKDLVPGAFHDGKLDIAELRKIIGQDFFPDDNSFGLRWHGKEQCIQLICEPSKYSLLPLAANSIDWNTAENLFIEGDNLEALKILQSGYLDKIKTIYIDPPYNTGNNSFTYTDKFYSNSSQTKTAKIKVSVDSLTHSAWLCMIYPRLLLSRRLLRDDGLIFVSIDDNELANLKLIMDEIFGASNFIEIFCWAKSETPANLSRKSKKVVEYILCYQKTKTSEKLKGIRKKTISSNGLLNQSNKINTLVFPPNIVRTKIADEKIKKGIYGTDKYHVELLQDTKVKDGFFVLPVHIKAKFKWTQPKLDMEISKGTIINIPTMRLSPSYERPEYEAEVPPNLINSKVGVATNETSGNDLKMMFGAKVFDFPKPVSLIKYLLGFSDDPDGIVMDFFAGSGTTAQAVLEMNAEDSGHRQFICVQLDEKTPERSIARLHGYETISQITMKRIEILLEKINSLPSNTKLSIHKNIGCKYYKLVK
ncbi:MAG: site-specific DNA-methyltransferase [Ginsengibacter sp.]